MSVRAAADQSYENLKTALTEGRLPSNVADTAIRLMDRLHQPIRVSVMGMPGSGKSTVVNLLLNKSVVPEGVSLPTAQFLNGENPKAICTLSDGRMETVEGADPHAIAALEPMFVEFQLPLAALGRISILEVVAPETPKDQQRAMHWAAKRTDIALWCTHEFTTIEQALWNSLPEKVKDHALMLVTKSDLISQQRNLAHLVEEIRYSNAHQFNKIMPIATTDAIAARRADGTVDKPMMQKSGGLTLISSILRQVDQGLSATVDQADLILHKYRDATPNAELVRSVEKAPAPRPITRPVPKELAKSEPAVDQPVIRVVTTEPVATGSSRPIATEEPTETTDAFVLRTRSKIAAEVQAAKDVVAQAPADVAPEPKPESAPAPIAEATPASVTPSRPKPVKMGRPVAPVSPVKSDQEDGNDGPKKPRIGFMPKAKVASVAPRAKPETCKAYGEAIAYLTEQGRTLAQDADLTSDDLMTASADNITWLSDYLDDLKVTDDPVLEKSRSNALDASELVQLMQFEKNDDAGIEALTLVIQLKRDLEAEIALSQHASHIKAA